MGLHTIFSLSVLLQVILGLLCPFFIKTLDFKSKEELQQMPQTEAEHLENRSLDYDENEKPQSDAEVSQMFVGCSLLFCPPIPILLLMMMAR